jgi:hypothetical protein
MRPVSRPLTALGGTMSAIQIAGLVVVVCLIAFLVMNRRASAE